MKKLFSTFMAALLAASLLCAAPALAEDPAGTVIIQNATTAEEDTENTEFHSRGGIAEAKTKAGTVKSAMEGVDALAVTAVGTNDIWWKPAAGKLSAGTYEVFVWNIGQKSNDETWRDTATVAGRDPYARYTITTATGTSVRYVNQGTATGDANGWVSLGTYTFSGSGNEQVQLDKISNPGYSSYTYADDMKFVPVSVNEAKLLHVHTAADGAAITTHETAVEEDHIAKRIPSTATAYTVTLEAAPGSTVTIDGNETNVISGTPVPGTGTTHAVKVSLGGVEKTYTLTIDMEGADLETIALETEFVAQVPGRNTVFTPTALTTDNAGYYNVYVNAGGPQNYVNTAKVNVTVSHAGLREEKVIEYGKYSNQSMWIFAGKYYFSGNSAQQEQIIVTKALSNTGDYMVVQNVKLVAAAADEGADSLHGLSVTAGGKHFSVPMAAFDENGEYTLAVTASNSIGVMAILGNTAYDSLRINGTAVTSHTYVWPQVGDGGIRIPIVLTKGGKTESYTLNFHRLTGNDVTIAAYQATIEGTSGEANMKINSDGNAANNRTSEGSYYQFVPGFAEAGTYRILSWRPAFTAESDVLFGSANQPVEIMTSSGVVNKTVDWKSTPSKWVDLGTYALGTDAYVKFTKASDAAFLLMDKIIFVKQSAVTIDSTELLAKELDGFAYTTANDSITLTASVAAYMKVGDLTLESGVPANIPLHMGENILTLSVYNSDAYAAATATYTFRVLCTAKTVGTEAEGVTETGVWAPSVKAGYTAGRSAKYTEEGGTIFFPAELWGDYEVLVWRVADSAAFSAAVNGSESAVAAGAAEWVSLGEYTFSGAEAEGVTVTAAAGSAVYIDAVRFVPKGDYIFASAAVEATEGGYAASFIGTKNTEGTETLRVMVAVYSGNQMKNIAIESKTVSRGLFEFSDIFIAASEGDTVKAFLWSGLTPVYQTIKTP